MFHHQAKSPTTAPPAEDPPPEHSNPATGHEGGNASREDDEAVFSRHDDELNQLNADALAAGITGNEVASVALSGDGQNRLVSGVGWLVIDLLDPVVVNEKNAI